MECFFTLTWLLIWIRFIDPEMVIDLVLVIDQDLIIYLELVIDDSGFCS